MKDKELKRKDWQVLTARLLMKHEAYLKCVLENQAIIISKLNDIPLEKVRKKMDKNIKENTKNVFKIIRDKFPVNPDIAPIDY